MDLDEQELEATRKKCADKMFEKLGYKIKNVNDVITGTILIYDSRFENGNKKRIAFYDDKTITCSESYINMGKFNAKELKAINKKVGELGW